MVNKDSIDDMINLSLIDFQLKTFKPTSMLSDNPFFNILWDGNMLRNAIDRLGENDNNEHFHEQAHEHIDDENDLEVGAKYRVHDLNVK